MLIRLFQVECDRCHALGPIEMKMEAEPMFPPSGWKEVRDGTRLSHCCPTCAATPLSEAPSPDDGLKSAVRAVAESCDALARACEAFAKKAGTR